VNRFHIALALPIGAAEIGFTPVDEMKDSAHWKHQPGAIILVTLDPADAPAIWQMHPLVIVDQDRPGVLESVQVDGPDLDGHGQLFGIRFHGH
jgi:hypothetical protein